MIFFLAYTNENIHFPIDILGNLYPSTKNIIFAESKHPNVSYFEIKQHPLPFNKYPDTMLYQNLINSTLLNYYRVLFEVPTTFALTFVPYQHTSDCAVCSIFCRDNTFYFLSQTKKVKHLSYAFKTLESQVRSYVLLRINAKRRTITFMIMVGLL